MNTENNIIISGFMGTGKTTVGREVARRLNREFHDTDSIIESRTGMAIPEIFEKQGEPYFRELEADVIRGVSSKNNSVIATGGGALVSAANTRRLSRYGIIFCLDARPEILARRLCISDSRPLLKSGNLDLTLRELLAEREKDYQRLPNHIDTSDLDVERVAAEIISLYQTLISVDRERR